MSGRAAHIHALSALNTNLTGARRIGRTPVVDQSGNLEMINSLAGGRIQNHEAAGRALDEIEHVLH
jgi:hypothetical protein